MGVASTTPKDIWIGALQCLAVKAHHISSNCFCWRSEYAKYSEKAWEGSSIIPEAHSTSDAGVEASKTLKMSEAAIRALGISDARKMRSPKGE